MEKPELMRNRKQIFLSHSSADKGFVRKLAERISWYGHKPWIDEAEIKVGDSLITKLQQGLKSCEYMGIVLSPDSVSSPWVGKELETALTEEIISRSVIVLPILYKDCDIPGFLKGKVYADFRNPSEFDFSAKRLTSVLGDTGWSYAGDHPDNLIRVDLAITKADFAKRVKSYFFPRKSDVRFYEDGSGIDWIKVYNDDSTFEIYNHLTFCSHLKKLSEIFFTDQSKVITAVTMYFTTEFESTEQFQHEPDDEFVVIFRIEHVLNRNANK